MKNAAETIAYVRRLLEPADPIAAHDYEHASDDPEGRLALARILSTERKRPPRRPTRRRVTIVFATVLAFGAVGAAADAAGLIPSGVIKRLTRSDDPGAVWGGVDVGKATLVIEAHGPQGSRAQWWFAPGKKGGSCVYHRQMVPGKKDDGSTECSGSRTLLPARDEKLSIRYAPLIDQWMGILGRAASPAVTLRLTFQDGQQQLVSIRADGFFMAVFDREQRSEPIDVATLDPGGRVLSSERVVPTHL
jgi:hypothetical protein